MDKVKISRERNSKEYHVSNTQYGREVPRHLWMLYVEVRGWYHTLKTMIDHEFEPITDKEMFVAKNYRKDEDLTLTSITEKSSGEFPPGQTQKPHNSVYSSPE